MINIILSNSMISVERIIPYCINETNIMNIIYIYICRRKYLITIFINYICVCKHLII